MQPHVLHLNPCFVFEKVALPPAGPAVLWLGFTQVLHRCSSLLVFAVHCSMILEGILQSVLADCRQLCAGVCVTGLE